MKHVSQKMITDHCTISMRIAATAFVEDRLYDESFFEKNVSPNTPWYLCNDLLLGRQMLANISSLHPYVIRK